MNDREQRADAYWRQDLKVLARLVMKWHTCDTQDEKRKWKTAIDLQMRHVNWRAGQFPAQAIPQEFPDCDGRPITKARLLGLLKIIYE